MNNFFTCKECIELLIDLMEGNLDEKQNASLREHLAECPACLHFLKTYQTCTQMTQKLRDQEVQIPVELQDRLKSFLREQMGSL